MHCPLELGERHEVVARQQYVVEYFEQRLGYLVVGHDEATQHLEPAPGLPRDVDERAGADIVDAVHIVHDDVKEIPRVVCLAQEREPAPLGLLLGSGLQILG